MLRTKLEVKKQLTDENEFIREEKFKLANVSFVNNDIQGIIDTYSVHTAYVYVTKLLIHLPNECIICECNL